MAREALQTGRRVYPLVREKGRLSEAQHAEILTSGAMTRPRVIPAAVSAAESADEPPRHWRNELGPSAEEP